MASCCCCWVDKISHDFGILGSNVTEIDGVIKSYLSFFLFVVPVQFSDPPVVEAFTLPGGSLRWLCAQ